MEHINWWEDETNFPCLITNGEPGCLVVINHQVDGVGYDIRDGKYFLSHETTNWRLATLEEAMCLKGDIMRRELGIGFCYVGTKFFKAEIYVYINLWKYNLAIGRITKWVK